MKKLFFIVALLGVMAFAGTSLVTAANVTSGDTILSPYWKTQAGTTGIITFISIAHPSIAGHATSRRVTVNLVNTSGVTVGTNTYDIGRGQSQEIYIANTAITQAWASYTTSTNIGINSTSKEGGHVVITTPHGAYAHELSVWGAIFLPPYTSGFAMEFIGDKTDSVGSTDITGL